MNLRILFSLFILLITTSCNTAQNTNFETRFSTADSLLNQGLPREAIKIYDDIYLHALSENKHEELIRSIVERNKSICFIEEEPLVGIIEQLNKDIEHIKAPAQQIIHSLIAEIYWSYYQQNRWRFHNRTATVASTGNDIRTWDLSRLANQTIHHLHLSLQNEKLLQQTPINNFASLLQGDSTLRYLRPTLYDVLAHRALDIIKNSETGLTKPAETFTLNNKAFFMPASEFAKYNIESNDTLSLQFQSISIYQKLTKFRLSQNNTKALTELEIDRINYIFQNSKHPHKDSLTVALYNRLSTQDLPDESKAEVLYRLALHHYMQHNSSDENRLIKSVDICNSIIEKYKKTKAAEFAKKLKANIEKPEISLKAEQSILPEIPFRILLSWKNIDTVNIEIRKLNLQQFEEMLNKRDFDTNTPKSFVYVKNWKQKLPAFTDYTMHNVEIPCNGLTPGFYIIIAQMPQNNMKIEIEQAALIQVNSLVLNSRKMPEGHFFVSCNAHNGHAVANAKLELFKREYNPSSRLLYYSKVRELTSNINGEAVLRKMEEHINRILLSYKNDTLFINNALNYSYPQENSRTQTILYTDRAIYRPGQTVYFKGLVLEKENENYNIKTKHKATVTLKDVNWQDLSTLNLITNEYGTFSGNFTLPQNGLNGTYQLQSKYGSTHFRVEEYRRPTFEVLFDKPTSSFSFGDTVSIKGSATTFSGVPVGNAIVKYHVTRSEERYWWWLPQLPDKTIASGQTTSNPDGSFNISFHASEHDIDNPDRVMAYSIQAEVTNLNGETQKNQSSVRISNSNLLITCTLPDVLYAPNFEGLKIKANNLNGEEVPAKAIISITRLKSPGQLLSDRYWEAPDAFILEEKNFKEKFPNYPYKEENKPENWPKGKKVFEQEIVLPLTNNIDLRKWLNVGFGHYLVEINAKTETGNQNAKWHKTVRLIDEKPSKAEKTADWITPVKTQGEPGETAEIWISAINPQAPVRFELVKGDEILRSEIIRPDNKAYRLLIPIAESYRGNVVAQFVHVANNRNYQHYVTIEVPHNDKIIDITFNTFRDHLLPGENERWSLSLSDQNGKGIEAEMHATLYDASLEKFANLNWKRNFMQNRNNSFYRWKSNSFEQLAEILRYNNYAPIFSKSFRWQKQIETINLLNFNAGGYNNLYNSHKRSKRNYSEEEIIPITRQENTMLYSMSDDMETIQKKDITNNQHTEPSLKQSTTDFSDIDIRSNFNETAFFYPHLYSDKNGKLEITFTIPEAITRWRMMGFAHSKDFKHGSVTRELVTRKNVSLAAYAPRFMRESDTLTISATVSNLTNEALSGNAVLQWTNAVTFEPITSNMMAGDSILNFKVEANSSSAISWKIIVPKGLQAATYKVMAKAGTHSDGEQKTLPVFTNRQLVTESLPFMARGGQKLELMFDKMANHGSSTLTHHSYTIEYTSNPAWYAIQSLPYLMEYPYNCAEQVFSRLYSNAAASALVNSTPRIKAVFDAWKNIDTGAFLSNLEKNSELKSVLLEETPWLLSAKSESEAKQRIGLLFDLNHMGNELDAALKKLQEMQLSNGGFPWFAGMPDNRYITQHIAKGMGEMQKMDIVAPHWKNEWETIRTKAMAYLDARIVDDYNTLKKQNEKDSKIMKKFQPSVLQLHYLYTRSFYPNDKLSDDTQTAFDYMLQQAKKHWLNYNEYAHGLMAITFHRFSDEHMANRITKSLSDRAIRSQTEGMYWANNQRGYFWYQSPTETQALLINAFSEINGNSSNVEEMKIWLLRNKQSTHWKTTKATLAASYALLNKGYQIFDESEPITVKLAGKALSQIRKISPEAGTGYVKTAFAADEIKPEMAQIKVENPNTGIAWGAAYWQYFEQLDKITPASNDIEIRKQLYLKEKSESGIVLKNINPDTPIRVGDEVVIRLEIEAVRDMEYVHLKDMRASGFEPNTTISGYTWQGGLGYYRETKDAAMNFFISYLPKGVHVFEYSLRASHAGQFSNGITTLQCMYAPEFTTHSEGIRLNIHQK